jgi:cathepsin B
MAWDFLSTIGAPTISCYPYISKQQACSNTCNDNSTMELFKAGNMSTYSGIAQIQAEIMKNGPVESIFSVYQDFFSYSSGIYKHTTGDFVGAHAVKILGWGYSRGVRYWISQNSWGTAWGMEGFFWIEFGQCGIDSIVYAGPALI